MNLLEMTFKDLSLFLRSNYGRGDFHSGAILREVIKKGNNIFSEAPEFQRSLSLAARLEAIHKLPDFTIADKIEQNGTTKFVTRLKDDCLIESVIIPMKNYNTLCVSTQVGCRMGCRFCETAKSGLKRSLLVHEITGQLYSARIILGKKITNVVFMGMGEPFDNFDNLIQAIRVFNDQKGFDIALRHMTVSTCGLIPGIRRLGELDLPQLSLAISIHSADDGIRSFLMPVNRRYPLAELKETLLNYPLHKRRFFLIEYVLIKGFNDSPEDAAKLADYLESLKVRVNLIAYNPGSGSDFARVDEEDINRFAGLLGDLGLFVVKRWSKGQELMAGCGQLSSRHNTGVRPADENGC